MTRTTSILTVDPPPDLAIEIEITRRALDRLGIYRSARGPGNLAIQRAGRWPYCFARTTARIDKAPVSAAFPDVPMEEIERFATMEGFRDENAYIDLFWTWVRDELLPRVRRPRMADASGDCR